MEDRLLTPDEAAKRLRVTSFTIRKWLRSGELQGIKAGRLWRIKESEIETFDSRNR
jgi:excisionase family DNA binding protein